LDRYNKKIFSLDAKIKHVKRDLYFGCEDYKSDINLTWLGKKGPLLFRVKRLCTNGKPIFLDRASHTIIFLVQNSKQESS